jgi:tRNA(Ile)-lysidine synthase
MLNKIEEILPKKNSIQIAVAVSGGCDSLALTLMLDEFCRKKKIKLVALTVDHKMRKNSSDEAVALGKILAKKKIPHEILTISTKKIPQKNIEANLREARYELLCDFCEKNKIEYLFLGHHLGDVAENFLIRLFRGSGLDGLSTMSEVLEYKKIKLLRPFLDVEKDELKKFLRAKKVQWFEDETNDDEKFLRNKIRKFFDSFEEKNLIQKRIKKASDEISEMRDLFDEIMLEAARDVIDLKEDMTFVIEQKKFAKLNEKIALKILALILIEVSGDIYKPRLENVKNLYKFLLEAPIVDKPQLFLEKTLHRTSSVQLRSRCHPRGSGDPFFQLIRSLLRIPASARMTPRGCKEEVGVHPKSAFENNSTKSRDFYGCSVKRINEKSIAIMPKKNSTSSKNLRTILRKIF